MKKAFINQHKQNYEQWVHPGNDLYTIGTQFANHKIQQQPSQAKQNDMPEVVPTPPPVIEVDSSLLETLHGVQPLARSTWRTTYTYLFSFLQS